MASYRKINLNQCRIIFFDLEFYVPETHRHNEGICYNPWIKACKLLGGSFFSANPKTDFQLTFNLTAKNKSIKSFWLWRERNEAELVKKIFVYLNSVLKHKEKNGDILLCGIGITTSDVPVLIDLFKRYHLLTNEEAFRFQNKFRMIDLSQLAIGCFNQSTDFMSPKVKNDLINKFTSYPSFASGKEVWDLFENKSHAKIETRVIQEIMVTYDIYKSLLAYFRHFKKLELMEKKREVKNKISD